MYRMAIFFLSYTNFPSQSGIGEIKMMNMSIRKTRFMQKSRITSLILGSGSNDILKGIIKLKYPMWISKNIFQLVAILPYKGKDQSKCYLHLKNYNSSASFFLFHLSVKHVSVRFAKNISPFLRQIYCLCIKKILFSMNSSPFYK